MPVFRYFDEFVQGKRASAISLHTSDISQKLKVCQLHWKPKCGKKKTSGGTNKEDSLLIVHRSRSTITRNDTYMIYIVHRWRHGTTRNFLGKWQPRMIRVVDVEVGQFRRGMQRCHTKRNNLIHCLTVIRYLMIASFPITSITTVLLCHSLHAGDLNDWTTIHNPVT